MNYRLLTNIIAILLLIAFITGCIMIFRSTGWAGLLGAFVGFILFSTYKILRKIHFERKNKK